MSLSIGGARAEQPLAHFPGSPLTRIGGDLQIAGEHYRLAYFVTTAPISDVLRHFARQWADEGIMTTVDVVSEQEAVVSAFFTREGLVRSVVLLPHGKKTLGFSVLKDLWVREDVKTAPLPPIEGTLWSGDVRSRDALSSGFHRTSVIAKSLKDAREQLVRTLKADGWTPLRESDVRAERSSRRQRVLVHARRGEELVTTLVEAEPGVTAVTQALLSAPGAEQGRAK